MAIIKMTPNVRKRLRSVHFMELYLLTLFCVKFVMSLLDESLPNKLYRFYNYAGCYFERYAECYFERKCQYVEFIFNTFLELYLHYFLLLI